MTSPRPLAATSTPSTPSFTAPSRTASSSAPCARARAAREPRPKASAVSVGYVAPSPRAELYAHMDADLKTFTEGFHKKIAIEVWLRHALTGNLRDPANRTPRCHGCGEALVVRDRYRIDHYMLSNFGQCAFCGVKLPGAYEGQVGNQRPEWQPIGLATPS